MLQPITRSVVSHLNLSRVKLAEKDTTEEPDNGEASIKKSTVEPRVGCRVHPDLRKRQSRNGFQECCSKSVQCKNDGRQHSAIQSKSCTLQTNLQRTGQPVLTIFSQCSRRNICPSRPCSQVTTYRLLRNSNSEKKRPGFQCDGATSPPNLIKHQTKKRQQHNRTVEKHDMKSSVNHDQFAEFIQRRRHKRRDFQECCNRRTGHQERVIFAKSEARVEYNKQLCSKLGRPCVLTYFSECSRRSVSSTSLDRALR